LFPFTVRFFAIAIQLKAKHGSVFAFHGSSSENWHSILRNGLKNASGSKLQVNGAAYGSGIYLSPNAATSFGYCRMYNQGAGAVGSSNNRFLSGNQINCIAVCEVIDHDIKKSGSIWVMPHEDHVVTRFFFVYTNQDTSNAQNTDTMSQEFRKQALAAMGQTE
jgi:poly [ADP-ribose] polymerase 6/8